MSEESGNLKAAKLIANHSNLKGILHLIDDRRETIHWDKIGYGGLSGGTQAAISWIYCVFCDEAPPKDWGYRDPFESFFSMDRDMQELVMKALAIRHGFIDVTFKDRPKSTIELAVMKMIENEKHKEESGQKK